MKIIRDYDVVTDAKNGTYSVVDVNANAIYIYAENTRELIGIIKNVGELSYHECITKTRKAAAIFAYVAGFNAAHKKRTA